MTFKEVWNELLKGAKIKRPAWGGYWQWNEEDKTIDIHEKDGNIVKFNSEKMRTHYSIESMLINDWVIADETNCPLLGGIAKFGLNDAIRYAERGLKIRMNWWPKDKYVNRVNKIDLIFSQIGNDSIVYRAIIDTLYQYPDINTIICDRFTTFKNNDNFYWTWYEEDKSSSNTINDEEYHKKYNRSFTNISKPTNMDTISNKTSDSIINIKDINNIDENCSNKFIDNSTDLNRDIPTTGLLNDIQLYTSSQSANRGIDKVTLPNEVIMLAEEVGEVCKAVRQLEHTSPSDKESKKKNLELELADVFIVLLNICDKAGINLLEAFINKENINRNRKWQ